MEFPQPRREGSEIGKSRRPPELESLLRGEGRYVSDFHQRGALHLAFVRSPHAHARIERLDPAPALSRPGVVAVLTAKDLALDAGGASVVPGMRAAPRPILADEVVRFVGDPIAVIVAESMFAAADAAALVAVDYTPLPSVSTIDDALAPDAPLVHPALGSNLGFTLERSGGDVEAAFRAAEHVVTRRVTIPRIAGVPLETLGAFAAWDPDAERLTLWCTTQAPWRVHATVSAALGLNESQVRVIAPDVGGGFGVRGPVYGEYLVAAYVAWRFGRPARYGASRQEDFLVTQSARETVAEVELAVSREGRFLGLRVRAVTNLGAYATAPGSAQRLVALPIGAYDIPVARSEVRGVYTNTNPTGAYRGAGRPEAAYLIERMVDEAAHELGFDPVELRRQNFVAPERFPYRTALGLTYDSGDYAATLDAALSLLPTSPEAAVPGELIGVGLACYVEPTGGGWESGRVRVTSDGKVIATTGSTSQGQNHRTTFAQIVADRLGARFEDVEVRQGDTAENLPGIGTFGSRSTALGGGALAETADEVFRRGRDIAAHLLEAAPEDLIARDGRFYVVGSPERTATWAEVASAAGRILPDGLNHELDARTKFDMGNEAYANGACVAVVGIDPATGVARLRRLILAHDGGVAINPRLVRAQLEGGLTQGMGEALGEWLRYDADGQILSGSLLDYWIPHADEVPEYEIRDVPTPTPLNQLGAKGVGEAGTIAAPPAIVNAVLNALRPLGVRSIDMPLTPERIWNALQPIQHPRQT